MLKVKRIKVFIIFMYGHLQEVRKLNSLIHTYNFERFRFKLTFQKKKNK